MNFVLRTSSWLPALYPCGCTSRNFNDFLRIRSHIGIQSPQFCCTALRLRNPDASFPAVLASVEGISIVS